ncbi:helix-turn-helix domain-containing protein [Mucilaginibacter sp.]|uniref:AlbA family DNA-binding domain-containing protein n=1 Tax=Mucilaginibacter sp. TaxID=1882438 RepID=UPI0035BBC3B8
MTDLHLPWDDKELQGLLESIIPLGETTKVDFKRQLDLTPSAQAELLKDVIAFANTLSYDYKNYGFIVVGVDAGKLCYTSFEQNIDSLQATIDEVIKNHVEPFIPTYIKIFGSTDKAWGVVVIPPTKNAPHVVVKEAHKRNRGDIYVRRGTTTDKALPGDYARFFRQHLDEELFEIRQHVRELRKELTELKENKITLQHIDIPNNAPERLHPPIERLDRSVANSNATVMDKLKAGLVEQIDPVHEALMEAAKKVTLFLASNDLEWALHPTAYEHNHLALKLIEEQSLEFWQALTYIIKTDREEKYINSIIEAIELLCKQPEPPANIRFTDLGKNVRYYPLVMSLYIVFIHGTALRKSELIKQVKALELVGRSYYNQPDSVLNALFYIRRASEVFQAKKPGYPNTSWCDAVGSVVKDYFIDHLELEEDITIVTAKYFVGEFVLCIAPGDSNVASHPSAGSFFYYGDSEPVIKRFLTKQKEWLENIFTGNLRVLLNRFDRDALSMARQRGCSPHGFVGEAEQTAFPQSLAQ